ncbi:hypothetical protein ESZ50_11085 [Weissella muntiaci]|uniref:Uncharacterized protein n=1 Tax=Weissella muntiaci TaxID=2508881 RepID=A0A6C2C3L4_9LACO|nr:hypothetical protein [Weissella muntiaci]TYC47825.1 hypothetical protein ESZ50_11085 [Weissella muntiaci]
MVMVVNKVKKALSWLNRYDILINTLFMWLCVAFIGNSGAKWMRIFAVIAVFVYSVMLALMDGLNTHIIELQSELIEIEESKTSQYQELTKEYRKLFQQLQNKKGGNDDND